MLQTTRRMGVTILQASCQYIPGVLPNIKAMSSENCLWPTEFWYTYILSYINRLHTEELLLYY